MDILTVIESKKKKKEKKNSYIYRTIMNMDRKGKRSKLNTKANYTLL